MRQMNINIFSNQTLQELTDCLFWFIRIKMAMLKDVILEDITYQKDSLRFIMSLSMEITFMI